MGQFKAQILALQAAQVKILELNEQLEQISYTDSLTGIANRRRFDLVAERELSHARLHQPYLAFTSLLYTSEDISLADSKGVEKISEAA